jgi:biopolymer transport protein ExbD
MPKFKVKRGSTWVDMTAMCDVAFLLLTFFILTAKFRPTEIVPIASPSSRAENKLKDDLVTFTIDKEGKVYMAISKPEKKQQILDKLIELTASKYPPLDADTKKRFSQLEIVGVPIQQLPQVVKVSSDQLIEWRQNGQMAGIPTDTLDNQLGDWIMATRYVYAEIDQLDKPPIAIKGDKESNIKGVKRVIEILKEKEVYSYKLITSLEGKTD